MDLRHTDRDHGSLLSTIEVAIETVKHGMNGALFAMSKRPSKSKYTFFIGMTVDFLQMCAFVLPPAGVLDLGFPWAIRMFANILWYFQLGPYITNLIGIFPAVICSLILVVLQLANLVYSGYAWANREFRQLWSIKLLRYTTSMFVGVAYIPIVSILSNVFTCTGIPDALTCSVLQPIVGLVLGAFMAVAFTVKLTLFDPRPLSPSPGARPHSRIIVLHLCAKTAFSISFSILKNRPPSFATNSFWTIFTTLFSVVIAWLFAWYQPYYHQLSSIVRSVFSNVLAWFAICAFFQVHVVGSYTCSLAETKCVSPSTVNATDVAVFGGLILVVPLSWSAVHYRWYSLLVKPIQHCSNAFEFELKCRLMLQLYMNNKSTFFHSDNASKQEHIEKVNGWYLKGGKMFQSSGAIHVFHAHFILDFMGHRTSLTRRAIILAEKRGLGLDFGFIIYKTKHLLEEAVDETSDVLGFVKSEKFFQEALAFDRQCSFELVEFWEELSGKHPNKKRVRQLAQLVATSSAQAKKKYYELVKVTPNSVTTLKLLGSFLLDIVNDAETANRVIQKARQIEVEKSKNAHKSLSESDSDSIGVILVRGGWDESSNVGEILRANTQASLILNQASVNLVGTKIQSILVPPFGDRFSQFLYDFIENGRDETFERVHRTFLRAPDGVTTMVDLKLKPYTGEGIEFQVYILFSMRESRSSGGSDYVLVTNNGDVVGVGCECTFFRDQLEVDGAFQNPTVAFPGQPEVQTVSVEYTSITQILPDFSGMLQRTQSAKEKRVIFPVAIVATKDLQRTIVPWTGDMAALRANLPPGGKLTEGEVWIERITALDTCLLQVFIRERNRGGEIPDADDSEIGNSDLESDGSIASDIGNEDPTMRSSRVLLSPMGNSNSIRMDGSFAQKLRKRGSRASSVGSTELLKNRALAVRRTLLDNQRTRMDPTLAKMLRVYFRVTCLAVTVCMVEFGLSLAILETYNKNVVFVRDASGRSTDIASIAFAAHSLILINDGLIHQDEETNARQILKDASQRLKTIDHELFFRRAEVGGWLETLYEEPKVVFSNLLNGNSTFENLALYDSTLRLATFSSQAATLPLQDFTFSDPNVIPLISNLESSEESVLKASIESSDEFATFVRYSLDKVLDRFMVISVSLGLFTTILLILTLHPLIGKGGKIENTKEEILQVFGEIPSTTAKIVAQRFVDRLREVHGESVDTDEQQVQQQRQALTDPRKKQSKAKVEPVDKSNSGSRKPSSSDESGSKPRKRRCKKLISRCSEVFTIKKWMIVAKMGSVLFVALFYFAFVIVIITKARDSSEGDSSILKLLSRSQTKLIETSHFIRLHHTGALETHERLFESLKMKTTTDTSGNLVDELLSLHGKIMFGDADAAISGLLRDDHITDKESLALIDLYTNDGCLSWPGLVTVGNLTFTEADCNEFWNGVMSTGLHNALKRYADFLHQIEEAHFAGSIHDTQYWKENFMRKSIQDLLLLEYPFIQTQLNSAGTKHLAVTELHISTAEKEMLILSVGFLSVTLLCYFVFVRASLMSLDQEVKRTRALLLVIPEDVLNTLGNVQRFLVEQFGSSGRSVSSGSVVGKRW